MPGQWKPPDADRVSSGNAWRPPDADAVSVSVEQRPEERTIGGFLANAFTSMGRVIGDTVSAVAHPLKTLDAIGAIPVGIYEKLGLPVPKSWDNKSSRDLDAMVQHFTERYGSLEGAKKAIYEDPAGVAADLSIVLGGGSAALRAGSAAARAGGAARVAGALDAAASAAGRASVTVNPVVQAARGAAATGRAVVANPVGNIVVRGAVTALPVPGAVKAVIKSNIPSPDLGNLSGRTRAAAEAFFRDPEQVAAVPAAGAEAATEAPAAPRLLVQRLVSGEATPDELIPIREVVAETIPEPAPPKATWKQRADSARGVVAEETSPIASPEPGVDWQSRVQAARAAEEPPYVFDPVEHANWRRQDWAKIRAGFARQAKEEAAAAAAVEQAPQAPPSTSSNAPSFEAAKPELPAYSPGDLKDAARRVIERRAVAADVKQAAQNVKGGKASAVAAETKTPVSETVSAKPETKGTPSEPIPAKVETPDPVGPKVESLPEAIAPVPETPAASAKPMPDWESKPRAAKVDAFVKHFEKHGFTGEMVNSISPRQWKAVAQSAGLNDPSPATIEAIKLRMAGGSAIPEPVVERVSKARATVKSGADRVKAARTAEKPLPQAATADKLEPGAAGEVKSGSLSGEAPTGRGTGSETSVLIPGDTAQYAGRYRVRELSDVQGSHNGATFEPNPKYGLKNERNYSDAANQERIVLNSQAGKFNPRYLITDNPDALNGPPVVDSAGNVIGGNSRVMILGRAYGQAHGQDYKMHLVRNARQYGLDPDEIAGMKQPVLVREIPDSVLADKAAKLVRDTNKSGTAELTPAERAVADGKRAGPAVIDYLQGKIEAEGPNATLREVLGSHRAGEIINKLVEEGIFTTQEKPSLVDGKTGAITEVGKQRVEALMVGRLFRDSDQFARTPPGIRARLTAVSGPIARAAVSPEWNLQPVIGEAIDLLEYARAHGVKNLRDVIAQQDMFGSGPQFSEEAVRMAEALMGDVNSVRKAFKSYAHDAAMATDGTPSMFGTPEPKQSFQEAFSRGQ